MVAPGRYSWTSAASSRSLRVLMENKDIVLSREKIANLACGYDYMGETNIVDVYVRHLRAKIDDRFGIKLVSTVRGVGYVVREG